MCARTRITGCQLPGQASAPQICKKATLERKCVRLFSVHGLHTTVRQRRRRQRPQHDRVHAYVRVRLLLFARWARIAHRVGATPPSQTRPSCCARWLDVFLARPNSALGADIDNELCWPQDVRPALEHMGHMLPSENRCLDAQQFALRCMRIRITLSPFLSLTGVVAPASQPRTLGQGS